MRVLPALPGQTVTAAPPSRALALAARLFRHAVELPAAILVLAEICILSAGVFARFVLNTPLVWSDELAGILFLWLAMLGSVIALQRGQHMRMTALVNMLPARTSVILQAIATGAVALFLVLLLPSAGQYALQQEVITSPALGLSDMIRTAALPTGAALMLVACVLQVARYSWRQLAITAVVLAIVGALFWLFATPLQNIGNWNLLVFFLGLLLSCVLAGVPVGFAFGLATMAYLLTTGSTPPSAMLGAMDQGMSTLILLAIPLFVFLGALIEMTGMARAMVTFLAAILGHVRGGLSYVLLGAIYLVAGISGSKAADMAAVAPVLFPEMKKRGMDDGEMVSLLATAAAMSETVPPSIVLIAIGSATGVSIAALFAGGLLPAAVLALALALIARARAGGETLEGVGRPSAKIIGRSFIVALPALILPFVIRTAVIEGVATATEVSIIGITYAVLVGLLIYRRFDWRRVYPMLVDTASLSGAILFIIGAASAMGWALTQSGFSADLAAAMEAISGGRVGFMAISIVAFAILGSVLEGIPAIVLFGPLLFPIAQAEGINQVHYAIVAVLAMGVGLFSPPFGVGYYAACAIGRVNTDAAMKKIWPYMGALMGGLILVAAIPWLSTGFIGGK
ncbi:MAG: TRAP transporter large permease subunit [Acidocella sp.]|nr:TRAP transporter large permease subunit [Acidocella sp.]